MVLRSDGAQVGVQVDDGKSGQGITQQELNLKALSAFDLRAPPETLKTVKLSHWRITVGIMSEGAGDNEQEKLVCVVAVYQEHPKPQVHFVATQECFGDDQDDNESNNLPRVVKFTDVQQNGKFLGRFEQCTEEDILWYMDYMALNNGILPATGVAFPSAEAYGLHGEKGSFDGNGRAIKIHKEG
jgi:hypothetical protein